MSNWTGLAQNGTEPVCDFRTLHFGSAISLLNDVGDADVMSGFRLGFYYKKIGTTRRETPLK